MSTSHRPLALIILDGWGYREDPTNNAIAHANTPHWDRFWRDYPHTLLASSGAAVGLPDGQMGNSEVGHLTIGAGRVPVQDYTRINNAIANGEFFNNTTFVNAISQCKKNQGVLHIMGLLSPGGVHSHETQIHALAELAINQGQHELYVHAFLDGRDTPPQSAKQSLTKLDALFNKLNAGKIGSIMGRYYAMDRDNRWERTKLAYDALTGDDVRFEHSAFDALTQSYARGISDEFIEPTVISGTPPIKDNDVVIFMNFRADRARQLTRAFTQADFSGFVREKIPTLSDFVTLTEYAHDIHTSVAFTPATIKNGLSEIFAQNSLRQLHIAETEKYAHVTFFFNGGKESPYPNEERILIPSPKVSTYDLQPEMSALEITARLVEAITLAKTDVIICNFANPDMVGHTGNFDATIKAIETIDRCLGNIFNALNKVGGEMMITADHGNAEKMFDPKTGQAHTAHTSDPVPFIYLGREAKITTENGTISDVAPTILYLMNLPIPHEMTGKCLLSLS